MKQRSSYVSRGVNIYAAGPWGILRRNSRQKMVAVLFASRVYPKCNARCIFRDARFLHCSCLSIAHDDKFRRIYVGRIMFSSARKLGTCATRENKNSRATVAVVSS